MSKADSSPLLDSEKALAPQTDREASVDSSSPRARSQTQSTDFDEQHGCLLPSFVHRLVVGSVTAAEQSRANEHTASCAECEELVRRVAASLETAQQKGWFGTVIPLGAVLAARYRIDRFIARGGMGEVYEAFDLVMGERLALKTMTSALSGDPEALACLKAEVQLSRKVGHRNVCRIYDLGVHQVDSDGAPQLMFLTMEFVEGESLGARLLRDGPVPQEQAIEIARGILAGLQAAHEAGVLHRDLKSDNIMLRSVAGAVPVPVIMDFGLASALNPNSSRVSSDQAMVGSLAYMAPEQVQGDALRVATDIYSLGVILFEMLTGQLPFRASTPAMAALKRLQEPAPRVRSVDPLLGEDIDRVVGKCLQRRPHDRYRSARLMLQELDALFPGGAQSPQSPLVAGLTPLEAAGLEPPAESSNEPHSPSVATPGSHASTPEFAPTLPSGLPPEAFGGVPHDSVGQVQVSDIESSKLPTAPPIARTGRGRRSQKTWLLALALGGSLIGIGLGLLPLSHQQSPSPTLPAERVGVSGSALMPDHSEGGRMPARDSTPAFSAAAPPLSVSRSQTQATATTLEPSAALDAPHSSEARPSDLLLPARRSLSPASSVSRRASTRSAQADSSRNTLRTATTGALDVGTARRKTDHVGEAKSQAAPVGETAGAGAPSASSSSAPAASDPKPAKTPAGLRYPGSVEGSR